MDGDYIELIDNTALDVVGELVELLGASVSSVVGATFPVLLLNARTEVFVDLCGEGLVRLAVNDSRCDPVRRRSAARRIYRALLHHTDWSLRWTADGLRRELASRMPADDGDERDVVAPTLLVAS